MYVSRSLQINVLLLLDKQKSLQKYEQVLKFNNHDTTSILLKIPNMLLTNVVKKLINFKYLNVTNLDLKILFFKDNIINYNYYN